MRASHLPPNESLSTILFVVLFDFSISNLKQANTRERSGDLTLFRRFEWPILRVLRPQLHKVPRPMELALPRLCEICKSEAPSQPCSIRICLFKIPGWFVGSLRSTTPEGKLQFYPRMEKIMSTQTLQDVKQFVFANLWFITTSSLPSLLQWEKSPHGSGIPHNPFCCDFFPQLA